VRVEDYSDIVARALAEDLGDRGDLTTEATVAPGTRAEAVVVARSGGVVAGLEVARQVFATVDADVGFEGQCEDGDRVAPGTILAKVGGPAGSILTAERTALNLLARMSGVASATARLVEAVQGTGARITDTRKTMPGLRALDKYAVTVGGGVNHRIGLYDQVMIKDNHIVAAGGIVAAVAAVREAYGPSVKVTVEVEDLDQLAVVFGTDANRVLLDNMSLETLRRAVEMVGEAMETEASGGVTIDTVRAIAETGVDYISVGWITHSAPQVDVALDFLSPEVHR
jgi:nicotinate-nucleotide pyrophosphorylase (carboxylating)